ncbi:MAG: formylmethanofuran dehydrogenase subunit C [Methylophilus sp.]|jgi:formylmethanofuran dehydrogenase subunit C
MAALIFTLKTTSAKNIDCSALTANALDGKSLAQIQDLALASGHKVSDVFAVSGDDSSQILFKNSLACLVNIGHLMTKGLITIEGDCGDYLGNALQGGTIICKGSAGERVGNQMRRGMILVEGNVGDYCASTMKAGTIGVLGTTGARLGYGMKRGTLLLAKTPAPQATWLDCGLHSLPFLKLLFKSFALFDTPFAKLDSARVQRWMGDAAGMGKAEILVLQS